MEMALQRLSSNSPAMFALIILLWCAYFASSVISKVLLFILDIGLSKIVNLILGFTVHWGQSLVIQNGSRLVLTPTQAMTVRPYLRIMVLFLQPLLHLMLQNLLMPIFTAKIQPALMLVLQDIAGYIPIPLVLLALYALLLLALFKPEYQRTLETIINKFLSKVHTSVLKHILGIYIWCILAFWLPSVLAPVHTSLAIGLNHVITESSFLNPDSEKACRNMRDWHKIYRAATYIVRAAKDTYRTVKLFCSTHQETGTVRRKKIYKRRDTG